MVDPLIGVGISAARWLISPILSRLINKCFHSLGKDIPQKLQHLETTLIPQLIIIMEAAYQSPHKPTLKKWLDELKEAYYEAQDMLDLVEYERREKEVKAESSSKFSLAFKRTFYSPQKKSLIKSLEKLINEARDNLVPLFNLPSPSNNNIAVSSMRQVYRVTTSSPPPLVIGRDEDRNLIIKLLHEDSPESSSRSNCFSVIGVYGVGGSGKTTLAQYVCEYERKAEHFDLVMWVYVSREFDVNTILSKMFESAAGKCCDDFKNLDVLQNKVEERLSGKKFLLVLDDVWCNKGVAEHELDQVYSPLRVGKRGSKILVTTRMEDVAKKLGASNPIQLREFDNDQFLRLFMHYAFGDTVIDDKNLEVELKNIGKEIAEKLHKSPLAARTVAATLRGRFDSSVWLPMLRTDLLNSTKGALLLSYQHLEPHLQRCFAFCSLFPKGYLFKHNELLDLWIAEQFIETEDTGEYVRDVACGYLNELISSSFLQNEKRRGEDIYSVHDLLHDLAEDITGNEYFRIENDERREIPIQVRHLFINVNMQKEHIEKICKLEGLRTIIISHYEQTVLTHDDVYALFKRLQKLHVFSLDVYVLSKAYFPNSIGYLKHLRYLKMIMGSYNKNLKPETFNKFYNLCFLYIDSKFYSKISNIGSLTTIQTIPKFYVEKKRGFELKQLEKLGDLYGLLEILNLKNVRSKEDAHAAQLFNKVGLRELRFNWGYDDKSEMRNSDVEILEGLRPPPQITRISIYGYHGGRYPSWILEMCRNVNKLQYFCLIGCTYLESLPEHLEMLTNLTSIYIRDLPNLKMWQPLLINLNDLSLNGCHSLVFISKMELEMIMLSKSVQMSQVVTFLMNCDYQEACKWQFKAVESMIMSSNHSSKQTISITDSNDLQNCTMKRLDLIWQLSDVNNKLILPSSLKTLKLVSCSLTNNILWEGLQVATCLTSLWLEDIITTTSIPKEVLRCLKELRSLSILHCLLLTSLGGLEALCSLKYIHISCCPILTLDTTTTLPPSLRILRLTAWRPPADILGGLASLEYLEVDSCPSFGTEQVEVFQHCSSLVDLRLKNCKAHSLPANLLSLTSLKDLDINEYENLSVLPDLPASLEYINIIDCNPVFMNSCKESGHPNCLKLAHIPIKRID